MARAMAMVKAVTRLECPFRLRVLKVECVPQRFQHHVVRTFQLFVGALRVRGSPDTDRDFQLVRSPVRRCRALRQSRSWVDTILGTGKWGEPLNWGIRQILCGNPVLRRVEAAQHGEEKSKSKPPTQCASIPGSRPLQVRCQSGIARFPTRLPVCYRRIYCVVLLGTASCV